MKIILTTLLLAILFQGYSQNISDNKITFQYTQLPLVKIEKVFQTYETRVTHGYLSSNEDSLSNYALRQEMAQQNYEAALVNYRRQKRNSLTQYYKSMAAWEKSVNSGVLAVKPVKPKMPHLPSYQEVVQPRLNSPMSDEKVKQAIDIQGFKKGLGGSILTIDIQAIRNIRIVQKKSGSGKSTKYKYDCEYSLPVLIKFETPVDGVVLQEVILRNVQKYKMKDFKSQYDFKIYWLESQEMFYSELENYARTKAIKFANEYINNQLGFVTKSRKTEIYTVKKFKNYDYSDLTNAYSTTVQSLSLVSKDKEHKGAKAKLEAALAQWNEIMMESNSYDKKARINDKVSAMIRCNIAEIQLWLNQFDEAQATLNLAENARVLKAKNHVRSTKAFYTNSKTRWNVHH